MADCAPFGIYSFQNVSLTIDGCPRHRLCSEGDDAIMIEPTTELGTPIVGADGTSIVSITADQSAEPDSEAAAELALQRLSVAEGEARARRRGLTGLRFRNRLRRHVERRDRRLHVGGGHQGAVDPARRQRG